MTYTSCASAGNDYSVSGCKAACVQPSTTGYNFESAAGTTTADCFAPTSVACANGYSGTVTYTSCSSTGDDYSVSGCKAMCGQPSTQGYNFDSAAGPTTVDGFAPTGVVCASGYPGTVRTPVAHQLEISTQCLAARTSTTSHAASKTCATTTCNHHLQPQ